MSATEKLANYTLEKQTHRLLCLPLYSLFIFFLLNPSILSFSSSSSPLLPRQTEEREGEGERLRRERQRQPVNFYSSPKSLLAISVRQGRQQLLVITGSPSLLLSVGERREGMEGREEENMFQSQCLYLFIYFLTCDVERHNVYQL